MRIAILGLGFMGSTHLRAWRDVPGAVITAVSSEDERKLGGDLRAVGGNLGETGAVYDFSQVSGHKTWQAALNDPGVEAVDVCLPTYLHAEAAEAALRAGKHVLVEKPLALTAPAADRLIVLARQRKRILMPAQVLRFIPAYRTLIDAAQSGEFGPLRDVVLRRRCAAPAWSKWLGDPEKSGGGIFDLLIHDADLCVKLFGAPAAVSATGFQNLPAGIDTITASLYYPFGPAVTITGGWHHIKAYPFSMEYTCVADNATLEYNSTQGDFVTCYGSNVEPRRLTLSDVDGFVAELRYFHNCCESGEPPVYCPPEESVNALRIMALLLQARERNGEKIEWPS